MLKFSYVIKKKRLEIRIHITSKKPSAVLVHHLRAIVAVHIGKCTE
jgi:hypothetical protein